MTDDRDTTDGEGDITDTLQELNLMTSGEGISLPPDDNPESHAIFGHSHVPTHPFNLPTPIFNKIVQDQHFSFRTQMWLLALLGRLMYPLGEKDNWQVIPFLLGSLGNGKSLICKMVASFFPEDAVAWIGPEVDSSSSSFSPSWSLGTRLVDWSLWISQDALPNLLKHRKMRAARVVDWRARGLIAYNSTDTFGLSAHMARRLVVFAFDKPVPNDQIMPDLWHRFIDSGEAIPLKEKCKQIYLSAASKFGDRCIWDVLPASMQIQLYPEARETVTGIQR